MSPIARERLSMAVSVDIRRLAAATAAFVVLALAPTAHAAGGSALGWGYNYSGQVGNGTTQNGSCSQSGPVMPNQDRIPFIQPVSAFSTPAQMRVLATSGICVGM